MPLVGSTAHIINVTSQQWLTEKEAIGPNGALWTHQVAVIVPHEVRHPNTAIAVMTGGCNEGPPKPPSASDEYLALGGVVAARTGVVAIVIYQIPNCHLVYASDPSRANRSEDAALAWSWRDYLHADPERPELLINLPMAKGGLACMRAVDEYLGRARASAPVAA